MRREQLQKIDDRLAKATPAEPKHEVVRTSVGVCHKIGPLGNSTKIKVACLYDDCYSDVPRDLQLAADADLFAHAYADIRSLRKYVDELLAENRCLRDEMREDQQPRMSWKDATS